MSFGGIITDTIIAIDSFDSIELTDDNCCSDTDSDDSCCDDGSCDCSCCSVQSGVSTFTDLENPQIKTLHNPTFQAQWMIKEIGLNIFHPPIQ